MLDQVLKLATSQLTQQFTENAEIPTEQASNLAMTAGSAIFETLGSQISSGNTSGIMEMLSGGQTQANNPIVNSISQNVVSQLVQKAGLNEQMAATVSNVAVPFVMNMFNNKVQQQGGGLDIASLVTSAISGGNQGGGGLLGGLVGNLLGGNKNQQSGGIGQQVLGSVLANFLK
jgi:hypothetical protein